MKRPPRFALFLLDRLAPTENAVVGDLIETFHTRQSSTWFWTQATAVIAWAAIRHVRLEPLQAVKGLLIGWGVLSLACAMGDAVTFNITRLAAGWDYTMAWPLIWWAPLRAPATALAYVAFGFSAFLVARLTRKGPILLLHIGSVELVLAASAAIIASIQGPLPIPHSVFYLVHVTLPYQFRSGLMLVPVVMLAAGLIGTRRSAVTVV